jgi:predicted CopG family antitoxin
MSFKTITIKKSAYDRLLAIKKENESFSELFERLSNKNVGALKKLRGCTTFENKDKMLKEIYKKRKEKRFGE